MHIKCVLTGCMYVTNASLFLYLYISCKHDHFCVALHCCTFVNIHIQSFTKNKKVACKFAQLFLLKTLKGADHLL